MSIKIVSNRANRHETTSILIVVALLLVAQATPRIREASGLARAQITSKQSAADIRVRNQNAFAKILGEIRNSSSDILFNKTGRYIHAGIGFDPHVILDSADASKRGSSSVGDISPLIRAAERDFRGSLGSLERAIKPFPNEDDHHFHESEHELLPWYRVMTLSNPHFVRGYRVGGMTLADEGLWHPARRFIEEGLEKNQNHPDLFLLYQTLASFHLRGRTIEDYPWSEDWSSLSLAAAEKALELGLEYRPEHGKPSGRWTISVEEDFRYSAHLVPLILRHQKRLPEALERVENLIRLAPNYKPAAHTLELIRKDLVEIE